MSQMLVGTRRALLGGTKKMVTPQPGLWAFASGMAKRPIAGSPFETDPAYQGDFDGTGVPDIVTFPRGDLLGNPTYSVYSNFDPYQGTVLKWWTAETASADRAAGYSYVWYVSADYYARYDYAGSQFQFQAGGVTFADPQAIVAGTTYLVAFSYDTKKTIDGTNYCRSAIQNVIAYGGTALTVSAPDATIAIGSDGAASPANALIGGLTFSRRILTDSNGYGINSGGNDDELGDIYAAGAGIDPATLFGSGDITAMQPTDSTAGAYVTGEGEMWSHPLASSVVRDYGMWEGRMPGGGWAIGFNGTSTYIDCGSDASIDDLPNGAIFAIDIWFRYDATTSEFRSLAHKGSFNDLAGWAFRVTSEDRIQFLVYNAVSGVVAISPVFAKDGKWHLASGFYNDATNTVRTAVGGRWGAASVGIGAYVPDAAYDLIIGRRQDAAQQYMDGAIAWVEFSDNDRHGGAAGTDFENALPIVPYNDGNTTEAWNMETGTGANAVAMVTSPANDGTIVAGTWEAIWDREGTPVEPVGLEFDGSVTEIDCGSGATIDNIPSTTMDLAMWLCPVLDSSSRIATKANVAVTSGWFLTLLSDGRIQLRVICATSEATGITTVGITAGVWSHVRCTYIDATKTVAIYVDGIYVAQTPIAGVGAYQVDAANTLYIGRTVGGGAYYQGLLGRVVLSNIIRETANNVPPDMVNPPGVDGNTQMQLDMRDGTGVTATDTSGNANHGTITPGAGGWLNTTDGEEIEPGNRMYPHSMFIGSDAADDGIVIHTAPTNPSDSVMLPRISYGQDGRAWPIVDFAGTEFKLPRMHDLHTGGNGSATLINANGSFTQQLVGWLLYNITDGSSTTITAVSGDGTTITGVLAGGTDDDWDTNDEYIIRPPGNGNYCDYPIGTYAIWVLRTAAAAVDMKVKNEAGEGMMQIHMVEVQESILPNGDMESLDGGFPGAAELITGWINSGLDAGDTEPEAAIIHSGVQSLQFNAGAIAPENMYYDIAPPVAVGDFVMAGGWFYGTAPVFRMVASRLPAQATNAAWISGASASVWTFVPNVLRCVNLAAYFALQGNTAVGYGDDIFALLMNPIAITVTPANQANSLEGTGIRVDGLDTLPQPIPVGTLHATHGHIRFPITPRHAPATVALFGNATPYEMLAYFDATRLIRVYWSAANTLTMAFNDGGGVHTVNWNAAGLLPAGTLYWGDVIYAPSRMRLRVDGVQRAEIATPITFTAIPNIAYWGSDNTGAQQADIIIG